jgi:hypothetical protein
MMAKIRSETMGARIRSHGFVPGLKPRRAAKRPGFSRAMWLAAKKLPITAMDRNSQPRRQSIVPAGQNSRTGRTTMAMQVIRMGVAGEGSRASAWDVLAVSVTPPPT